MSRSIDRGERHPERQIVAVPANSPGEKLSGEYVDRTGRRVSFGVRVRLTPAQPDKEIGAAGISSCGASTRWSSISHSASRCMP